MTINKEILYQIITSIIDKKIDKCDFDVELVKYLLNLYKTDFTSSPIAVIYFIISE